MLVDIKYAYSMYIANIQTPKIVFSESVAIFVPRSRAMLFKGRALTVHVPIHGNLRYHNVDSLPNGRAAHILLTAQTHIQLFCFESYLVLQCILIFYNTKNVQIPLWFLLHISMT